MRRLRIFRGWPHCSWRADATWREKGDEDSPVHAIGCTGRAYSGGVMSDLRLQPFDFQQALARAGLRADGTPRAQAAPAVPGGDFRSAMADALKSVSQTQFEAQRLQRELSLDNPAVSLEETMLAMQKSQLGFQATLQVRNRLVSAYSEIMNMQV
jgi:flagellar hook-basal body complex protein FliE